ncbi:MAG: PAS domain S-box protein, partial [Chloroflexi bacterium]|nr:PAS domain S-box protein [Chloroflexota bacterium]
LGSISLGFGVLVGVMEARAMGLGFDLTIARLFPAYAANYRLLFDTATDAVVALDDRSRILLWNAAATRIFGYTSAKAIGARLPDLLFPGSLGFVSDEIDRLAGSESQIKHLEMEARRKNGQMVPVEISLSGRMTPSGWLSAVVIRDITERKKAEAAIEKGEKQMRHLIDSSIIGIIVADSGDTVIEANDAFLDMVGYSREDLIAGRINWLEMTPAEYRYLDEKAAEELFKEGHCTPFEKEYIRKDGSRVPILISGSLWDASTDNPTWITFIVDITKKQEAQKKAEEYQRLATIGQLSGSIAHELRNPLGVVDGSAYYLQKNLPDASERIKAHLQRMRDAVSRSVAIIETLLRLTQMKEPRLYSLDLKAFIPYILADCNIPPSVETAHSFCEGEVSVRGDQEQLRLAFRNIISNAVQAMEGKGTLKIEVRTADGLAEVCFADSGPGISAENLERVFEPLFTTKARGIGLGLTLTRNIIEKHQGTITAKSEVGKGATFVVCLPLHQNGNPFV